MARSSRSSSSRRSAPARTASSTPAKQTAASSVPATQQAKQPGMFAQMASTAAGVAVGSTVGHVLGAGITGMFSGGQTVSEPQRVEETVCGADRAALFKCMETSNDVGACQFYMDMLKQCQQQKQF